MLSPKDAFVNVKLINKQFNKNFKYNANWTGKLTYEEFTNLLVNLYKGGHEKLPAVSIIRDLYEFIDIKNDGVIDINEWTQTFNQLAVRF